MAKRFEVGTEFTAYDKMTSPIRRMQRNTAAFARSFRRNMKMMNMAIHTVVRSVRNLAFVAGAVFGGITFGAFKFMKSGAQFEQSITNVAAVMLKTRKDIVPLEEMALKLGRSTKFTATQASDAMLVLARAGFSVNEIMQTTPATLAAAAASGLEIAEVADHVSNVLKGMGLEMNQAAYVTDVLALASSKTNSTIGSLGESMQNAAANFREFGIPVNEAVAAVALLQDVGLDASVAGTAVNRMLDSMASPTGSMKVKMEKLGLSFKDAKGDMIPFMEVLKRLDNTTEGMGGNMEKAAFLSEMMGIRAKKAGSNLIKLFDTGRMEKMNKILENAEGSASKMAETRMDTVIGSLYKLASAFDAVKLKVFDLNKGPLKETIDNLTEWINLNEEVLVQNLATMVDTFVDGLKYLVNNKDAILGALKTFNDTALATARVLDRLNGYRPEIRKQLGFDVLDSVAEKFGIDMQGGTRISEGKRAMVSPSERLSRSIEEKNSTTTHEVELRMASGMEADVLTGSIGGGLKIIPTGM